MIRSPGFCARMGLTGTTTNSASNAHGAAAPAANGFAGQRRADAGREDHMRGNGGVLNMEWLLRGRSADNGAITGADEKLVADKTRCAAERLAPLALGEFG